jgi:hypothetical protein
MSREAFCEIDEPVSAVDLICGKQGRTPTGRGAMPDRYPVYTESLIKALHKVVGTGGNLLVSGAAIASDPEGDAVATAFTEEVLGIALATAFGTNTGCIADMPFSKDLNEEIYCVERPDGLRAAGKGAKVWLRYPGSLFAAAVCNQTEGYRTVTLGVPVETILKEADRDWIFSEALDYLYSGKKPAIRR